MSIRGRYLGLLLCGLLLGGCADGGGSSGGGVVAIAELSTESGDAPLTVVYDGSSSSGSADLVFSWSFGDGTTSSESQGTITFDDPGLYLVELEVTDSSGTMSRTDVLVNVGSLRTTENFQERVVYLTNLERRTAGLPPLASQGQLAAAAAGHALDMATQDYFDHQSLDGRSFTDRIEAAGYVWTSAAENIAAGYGTPDNVVLGWMNSPGHRDNILRDSVREIGVGYVDATGATYGDYWVQNFGRQSNVYPVVIDNDAFATDTAQVRVFAHGEGWADEMMVWNFGEPSANGWEPFREEFDWDLTTGAGVRRVHVRLRQGTTEVESSDEILRR